MTFTVESETRTDVRDVTDDVADALSADAGGACTVFVRHTTAGVVVNEAESRLLGDVEHAVDELIPDEGWKHDEIDNNADSHLRAMLLGESVTVPVEDGELALGTWQSILFVECDGPRDREVEVVVH
jgi:secondary thiamine-phosphate synthase enzyme